MRRSKLRFAPLVVLVVLITATSSAQTEANTVAPTKAENDTRAIGANDLKPVECASITVTAKISGSGTITGTAASELITGSAGADNISGGQGNDCILGGAGNDTLNGGPGTDVCIGGGGTDTFSGCETQLQ